MITIYPHTDHYVFSFIYIFMYKKTAKSNKKLKKFLLNAVLGIRTPEVFTPRLFSRQHPRPTGHTAYLIFSTPARHRTLFIGFGDPFLAKRQVYNGTRGTCIVFVGTNTLQILTKLIFVHPQSVDLHDMSGFQPGPVPIEASLHLGLLNPLLF